MRTCRASGACNYRWAEPGVPKAQTQHCVTYTYTHIHNYTCIYKEKRESKSERERPRLFALPRRLTLPSGPARLAVISIWYFFFYLDPGDTYQSLSTTAICYRLADKELSRTLFSKGCVTCQVTDGPASP